MPQKKVTYNHFIEGDRIYLREVRSEDVTEHYYGWLNDPDINKYLETRYVPRSKSNIQSFVQKLDGRTDEIFLAICLKKSKEHIGNIKLGPINSVHRYADISLLIG